jgi:(1->4)-alpha-D-glucan 1-alpha-D-glucosylmutase
MRMLVLAEVPEVWRRTLALLSRVARRYRSPEGPSRGDEYLFYQTFAALWDGTGSDSLADRLVDYARKAAREAKLNTSWTDPNEAYETALERLVRGMADDPRAARAVEPLARTLAHHGFVNSLSQLVLKLTSPGIPDFYQGTELLDLSLVDPDNRRPVDFRHRARLLAALEPHLASPDAAQIRAWVEARDERAKMYVTARVLRFRQAHPEVFGGTYRPLESAGTASDCAIVYAREAAEETLLVMVPRFPALLERLGGWTDTRLTLPPQLMNRTWTEALSGEDLDVDESLLLDRLALPCAVLLNSESSG